MATKTKKDQQINKETNFLAWKAIAGKIGPETIECCICKESYEYGAFGSGEEHGRGRQFCPGCMSDILRTNKIGDDDFMDG